VLSARAALFHGPGLPLEFRSLPIPEPGPSEVLVQISLATICGSDLHTLDGRRQEPTPCILGHEAMGRVVALGPGRDPSLIGSRVSWTLADSCGHCPACRLWDLPQKCDHLFKYGHAAIDDRSGLNGCYASHVLLRAGTRVFPLPEVISDAMAAPANCALATMVAATEPLASGGTMAVIQGAGLLGLYACALLKSFGWQRVLVIDRFPRRLDLVGEFGGEPVSAQNPSPLPSASADAVIEACGDSSVVPEGIRILRPGGFYAWAGMVHPKSRLSLTGEAVIRKCLTIRGSHNYGPRHLEAGLRFLERHAAAHPWERLVSPPMALSELATAFLRVASGEWPRVAICPDAET